MVKRPAKQLLDLDKSVAYLTADNDEKKAALHVAASQGHVGVMKEIISQCPDCWDMVTSKGQNILHVAVGNERKSVVKFILQNPSLKMISSLLNQRDCEGNTPLHLHVVSDRYSSDLLRHRGVDTMVFNKQNSTPLDFLTCSDQSLPVQEVAFKAQLGLVGAAQGWRTVVPKDNEALANKNKIRSERIRKLPEDMRKLADTRLLVAALIATVTFTAGFTVPGGYDGNDGPNQGMAILTREAAFKAFMVTDCIAMILSTCAVFIHFMLPVEKKQNKVLKFNAAADILSLIAAGAMVLAFITGTYVVLGHSSSLAISVCVIGCLFFLVQCFVLRSRYLHIVAEKRSY